MVGIWVHSLGPRSVFPELWIMQLKLAPTNFRMSPHQTPSWRQGKRFDVTVRCLYVFLTQQRASCGIHRANGMSLYMMHRLSGSFYHVMPLSQVIQPKSIWKINSELYTCKDKGKRLTYSLRWRSYGGYWAGGKAEIWKGSLISGCYL